MLANASDPSETIANTATWTGSGCTTDRRVPPTRVSTTVTNGAAFTVTKTATAGGRWPVTTADHVHDHASRIPEPRYRGQVSVTDSAPAGTTYVIVLDSSCTAPTGKHVYDSDMLDGSSRSPGRSPPGSRVAGRYSLDIRRQRRTPATQRETITNTATWTGVGLHRRSGGARPALRRW